MGPVLTIHKKREPDRFSGFGDLKLQPNKLTTLYIRRNDNIYLESVLVPDTAGKGFHHEVGDRVPIRVLQLHLGCYVRQDVKTGLKT